MDSAQVDELARALQSATDDDGKLEVLRAGSAELDWDEPEIYERVATALAVAVPETPDFVWRSLETLDEDERELRFLLFTMAAISCRRVRDRQTSTRLFARAEHSFDEIPFFKHLQALSLSHGSVAELRQGLELEEEAYRELHTAGAAHAISSFILDLVEQDHDVSQREEQELERALRMVNEAIDQRPHYPKFFFTRGRILRRLGDYDGARGDLRRAVEFEDRRAVDAQERLRDYHVELALLNVDLGMDGLRTQSSESVKRVDAAVVEVKNEVDGLRETVGTTVERLRDAEIRVVTAVAFVASAIGLIQVTLSGLSSRPFLEAIALVVAFGITLFGAVGVGAHILRRGWRSTAQ